MDIKSIKPEDVSFVGGAKKNTATEVSDDIRDIVRVLGRLKRCTGVRKGHGIIFANNGRTVSVIYLKKVFK